MRFRVVILMVMVVLAGALSAQETVQRMKVQETNAQASPPALGGGNTPGSSDFFSLFTAALQSYSESGGEAITLDYNLPEGIFGKSLASKAQVVLKKPVLFEKLKTEKKDQAALLTTLESELSYGDDVTLTFTISPNAKKAEDKIEKAFKAAAGWLYADKMQEVLQRRRGGDPREAGEFGAAAEPRFEVRAADMTALAPGDGFADMDAVFRQEATAIAGINGAVRRTGFRAQRSIGSPPLDPTEAAAQALEDMAIATQAAEELTQEMAALAANQSKFNFNASFRDRRDTVGPDEWFVKTSYEYGPGTNVEKRLRENQSKCNEAFAKRTDDPKNTTVCAKDYKTALKEAAKDEDVKMGKRLTFSLEYRDQSAIDINRADPVFTFTQKSSRSLIGSLVAGRDMFKDAEAKKANDRSGRIELDISYADVSGDKDRHDKLIGKLTYSQRINEKLYIPISLIYASHADYLTNVDRKFNAHFGIAYKIPSLPKSTPKGN